MIGYKADRLLEMTKGNFGPSWLRQMISASGKVASLRSSSDFISAGPEIADSGHFGLVIFATPPDESGRLIGSDDAHFKYSIGHSSEADTWYPCRRWRICEVFVQLV